MPEIKGVTRSAVFSILLCNHQLLLLLCRFPAHEYLLWGPSQSVTACTSLIILSKHSISKREKKKKKKSTNVLKHKSISSLMSVEPMVVDGGWLRHRDGESEDPTWLIKRGVRTQDTATAFAGYGTGNRTPALVRYKNESINRLVISLTINVKVM